MKTLIIGYGNLGKVYANAFLKYKIIQAQDLYVLLRNQNQTTLQTPIQFCTAAHLPREKPDVVILSVKPQDFHTIQPIAKQCLKEQSVIISVMAGISIADLQKELNHDKVVRAMPNSPIELGIGITGFTAAPGMSFNHIRIAEDLLATTGRTLYIEEEKMLNAVTALSGSGPAYFFYILQAMINAGIEMGFSESTATTLVKQTMLGAYHLFNESGKTTDELIKTVASKGGTTEAALKKFEQFQMNKGLLEGILDAERRAGELSNYK